MKTALDSTPLRLKEVPIEGTAYSALEPLDPKQYLTIPERVAIARRIQELAPKLPHYVVVNRRFVPKKEGPALPTKGDLMETPTKKNEKKPAEKPAAAFHSRNDSANSGHAATLAADAEAAAKQQPKPTAAPTTKGTAVKKPAAAKKPAAPKKPSAHVAGISGKLEKFAGYPLDAKVAKVSDKHDFVKGSIREQVFLKLLRATTVAEAKKVSTDPWHLRNAVKTHRIKIG